MRRFPRIVRLVAIVALVLPLLHCSKSGGVDDEDTDVTPPVVVSDLEVIAVTAQTVTLQWTTPSDFRDDHSGGMVDGYDIRCSFNTITDANFAAATPIDPIPGPLPAGQVQQWPVSGLAPDSVYYFALKSVDDRGNWSGRSNCASVHCPANEIVVIADTALERVVREHLQKPTGDLLTTDVDTIWQLVVPQAGIANLDGLEHFTSLVVANFPRNEISDLTPLAGLSRLAGLYLSANNVSDLTPLTGKITLRQIHLDDNPILSIAPLASLDSLQQVVLMSTAVTDFSPLYDLTFLTDVNFAEMNLSDVSFISHLTRLQVCVLGFNDITSLTPLHSLSTLEVLNLMQNEISDIGPLATLVNLRELRLTNNDIADVAALVDNAGLATGDVIYLEGNPLSATATGAQIPALEGRGVTVYH